MSQGAGVRGELLEAGARVVGVSVGRVPEAREQVRVMTGAFDRFVEAVEWLGDGERRDGR